MVVVRTHHYEGGASGVSGGTVKVHCVKITLNISNGDLSRMLMRLNWSDLKMEDLLITVDDDCDDFEWIFFSKKKNHNAF